MKTRTRFTSLLMVAALVSLAGSSLAEAPVPTAAASIINDTKSLPLSASAWASGSGQPGWQWPVRSPWQIRREFVAPKSQYGAGHRGVDLRVGPGDEIISPASGTVFFAGMVVDRPVVSIRHSDGLMSSFEPVASGLVVGQEVIRGERIGTVTSGGHCADSCMHFGVRLHGQYISPRLPFGTLPRAVLLPMSG